MEVDGAKQSPEKLVPREYQLEIVERALRTNTIACLGTGTGKTFIAILVIKELSHQIKGDFSQGAKRTVFLVPSVPLVKQQGKAISNQTGLKVGMYVGADNVDSWGAKKWMEEFEKNQVLVMTVQIMVNILMHGDLKLGLNRINLIIFDECHHTTKEHPCVKVMERFKDCNPEDQPRVLGLTASLLNGTSKSVFKMEQELDKLQETLESTITTAHDLISVKKHGTEPDEGVVSFASTEGTCAVDACLIITELVSFLQSSMRMCRTDVFVEEDEKFGEKLKNLKNEMSTCLIVLNELGPWAAYKVCQEMAKSIRRYHCPPSKPKLATIYKLCISRLRIAAQLFHDRARDAGMIVITPKVKKLCRILMSSFQPGADRCGIVFVERRHSAIGLCALLKKLGKEDRSFSERIHCDFLTGHGNVSIASRAAHMATRAQEKKIRKFREGKINVLISTSVAEEGLDIRKCNLVVRFDELKEFRAYIQSRGRARDKPAKFIIMTPHELQERIEQRLINYRSMEHFLLSKCREEHVDDEDEEDNYDFDVLHTACPPFWPNPEEPWGTKADLSSAAQIVNQYCSTICPGVSLTPRLTYSEVLSAHFSHMVCQQCDLLLPRDSRLGRIVIKGTPMPNKKWAKRAACLKAVRLLHEAGELGNDLRPCHRQAMVDDDNEVGAESNLTHKHKEYYLIKIPECLKPQAGASGNLFLYALDVQADTEELAERYLGHRFGILTQQQLEVTPNFDLFPPNLSVLHVSIRFVSCHDTLDAVRTHQLHSYHEWLFRTGLDIPRKKHHLSKCISAAFGSACPHWSAVVIPLRPDDSIDFSEVERFVDCHQSTSEPWSPIDLETVDDSHLSGRVVSRTYLKSGSLRVVRVKPALTATCPMEAKSKQSFKDYFFKQYGLTLRRPELPLLEVSGLDCYWTYRSRLKGNQKSLKHTKQAKRKMYLPAELCEIHVAPARWRWAATLLPTILSNVFHWQQAGELHRLLVSKLDYLNSRLVSQELSSAGEHLPAHGVSLGTMQRSDISRLTFPSVDLIFQALSTRVALFSEDLERLEVIGDNFLKLSVSVYLTCSPEFLDQSEGLLTQLRTHAITNSSLYQVSRHCGFAAYLFRKLFDPKMSWVPPGFKLHAVAQPPVVTPDDCESSPSSTSEGLREGEIPEDMEVEELPDIAGDFKEFTHQILSLKSIGDGVESLIGAFLVAGGNDAARLFMAWAGIPNCAVSAAARLKGAVCSPDALPPIQGLVNILEDRESNRFMNPQMPPSPIDEARLFYKEPYQQNRLHSVFEKEIQQASLDKFQHDLGYQFREASWLLQAVTHPSYGQHSHSDVVTVRSYQRLEFLGDAVLDYLVMRHLYENTGESSPGELTTMLHYITSNETFACIAVRYGWDRFLRSASPVLYHAIQAFVSWRMDKEGITRETVVDHRAGEFSDEDDIVDLSDEDIADLSDNDDAKRTGSGVLPTERELRFLELEKEEEEDEDDEDSAPEAPKALGDLVESVAAAVFMDVGMDLDRTYDILWPFLKEDVEFAIRTKPKPEVQQLHEACCGARFTYIPNQHGDKIIGCYTADGERYEALASTKELARTRAARKALKAMGKWVSSRMFHGTQKHTSTS